MGVTAVAGGTSGSTPPVSRPYLPAPPSPSPSGAPGWGGAINGLDLRGEREHREPPDPAELSRPDLPTPTMGRLARPILTALILLVLLANLLRSRVLRSFPGRSGPTEIAVPWPVVPSPGPRCSPSSSAPPPHSPPAPGGRGPSSRQLAARSRRRSPVWPCRARCEPARRRRIWSLVGAVWGGILLVYLNMGHRPGQHFTSRRGGGHGALLAYGVLLIAVCSCSPTDPGAGAAGEVR